MSDFPGFKPIKANFTLTPNQFFDRVVGRYHPCVVTVVAILIRSTLGWEDPDTGERRAEAELPLSAFVRPELCESSARKGIAGAIEAGFMVQTEAATNRQPARYALRWDDAEQQKRAVQKQRRAQGKMRRRGVAVMEPKWKKRGASDTPLTDTPLGVTALADAPPNSNDSERKSSSEKKFKKSEKSNPGESFLPAALEEKKEPDSSSDVLDRLPRPAWAALEAEARTQLVGESKEPVLSVLLKGRDWRSVKNRMRTMIAAGWVYQAEEARAGGLEGKREVEGKP